MSFQKLDENPSYSLSYVDSSKEPFCSSFKNEFQSSMIKLSADTPKGRINWVMAWGFSRIITKPEVFLLMRSFSAIFAVVMIIDSWVKHFDNGIWFAFLTHWIMTINTIFLVLLWICTIWLQSKARKGTGSDGETADIPLVLKIIWFLQNTGLVCSCIVTFLYWTLLAKGAFNFYSFFPHGGLFILVTIDFLLSAYPFHYAQTIFPIIIASLYTIFNGLVWAAGWLVKYNPWVYEVVCWCTDKKNHHPFNETSPYTGSSNPVKTAIITLSLPLIVVPLLNLLFFFLSTKFRKVALLSQSDNKLATPP